MLAAYRGLSSRIEGVLVQTVQRLVFLLLLFFFLGGGGWEWA